MSIYAFADAQLPSLKRIGDVESTTDDTLNHSSILHTPTSKQLIDYQP